MKSLNTNYLSRLDHLRFFAAILVVFHHFRGSGVNIPSWSDFRIVDVIKVWLVQGSSGVSLFLVLSAFLFTIISNAGNRKIDYKLFIFNRVLRIFPLLIIAVFIVITINRGNSSPVDILRVLTLQLNTGHPMTGWGHEIFPIGPIWTISVEFQFYLLFPVLVLLLHRFGVKHLLLMVIFIVLTRLIVTLMVGSSIYYDMYHTILGRFDQFLIGMILGWFYLKYKNNTNYTKYSLLICLFSLVLITLLMYANKNPLKIYSSIYYFSLEAIAWSMFIFGYITVKCPKNIVFNKIDKWLSLLGMFTFSIYLFHLPIGIIVTNIFELADANTLTESILNTTIRLPFILFFSLLSYYAIEKPFMSFRKKYLI